VTNGAYYQQYSFSFVEPWLGGRKPNNLSTSIYWSRQTNGVSGKNNPLRQELDIFGVTVGLGKRLTIPDDYFILRYGAGYQNYELDNWTSLFTFSNGTSKVITLNGSLSRNSIDAPFFARSGSDVTFSVKFTPPWTAMGVGPVARAQEADGDPPSMLTDAEKYAYPEFAKFKFTTQWFTRLTRAPKSGYEAVLMLRAGFGFLSKYKQTIAYSPFERFYMGGVPLSGFSLDGREIIYLRGYEDFSISNANGPAGDLFISKYATEVRFPISLNPSATIYALGFFEAGNSWNSIKRFDPFRVYKSAGVGLRLFLPMFGPMGLDYGWRLDDVPTFPGMNKGQFHFTIGIDLGEL
jgi:outer membrane protein insertion porin family